ncbi:zinc finger protein 687a-like [Physella acuta]|uniref:zinc finger protein 687a-like n=1 Tax=Physella acuta TaxID=109671 RepID=UPI0027DC3670|nr:zinc finger protein 687a-like [Physella acuta]XP_059152907.1 zinc finger protein 687a-like [Physella acuta]
MDEESQRAGEQDEIVRPGCESDPAHITDVAALNKSQSDGHLTHFLQPIDSDQNIEEIASEGPRQKQTEDILDGFSQASTEQTLSDTHQVASTVGIQQNADDAPVISNATLVCPDSTHSADSDSSSPSVLADKHSNTEECQIHPFQPPSELVGPVDSALSLVGNDREDAISQSIEHVTGFVTFKSTDSIRSNNPVLSKAAVSQHLCDLNNAHSVEDSVHETNNIAEDRVLEIIYTTPSKSDCSSDMPSPSDNSVESFSDCTQLDQDSDFQPIILDVRGACPDDAESLMEDSITEESQTADIEVGNTIESQTADIEVGNTIESQTADIEVGNTIESQVSNTRTATKMLKDIIHQVKLTDLNKKDSDQLDARPSLQSPKANNLSTLLTLAKKSAETDAKKSLIPAPKQISPKPPAHVVITDQVSPLADHLPATSVESTPLTGSLSLAVSDSAPMTSSVNNYCLIVPGKQSAPHKNIALLIPQMDLVNFTNGKQVASQSSKPSQNKRQKKHVCCFHKVPVVKTYISAFSDRITQMIASTLDKFQIKTKDLKSSQILDVPPSWELEQHKHPDLTCYCSVCGEGFYQPAGLNLHLARNIFHIQYQCPPCKTFLSFYNKCSLWMHVRNVHQETAIRYEKITLFKPTSFVNEPDIPHFFTNCLAAESTAALAAESTAPLAAESTAPLASPPVINPTSQVVSTQDYQRASLTVGICGNHALKHSEKRSFSCCSVCQQIFASSVDGKTAQLSSDMTLCCTTCGMNLPSLCAFKAHRKIHLKTETVICPECGEMKFKSDDPSQDGKKAAFDHLDACKHFNRVVVISCLCGEEFLYAKQLAQHFVDIHLKTLYKCKYCVLAFTQSEHLQAHIEAFHKSILHFDFIEISILCSFCQQIFRTIHEVKTHVEGHILKVKCKGIFKWKCFLCSKVFKKKENLIHHSDKEHPHKPKRCTNCYSLFCSRKNLVDHIMLKKCAKSTQLIFHQCVDIDPYIDIKDVNYSKLFTLMRKAPAPTGEKSPASSSGKSPASTAGKSPAPTAGKAPAPSTGKSPAPSTGKSPAPTAGKSPAPISGKAPAPISGKAPLPRVGKSPQVVSKTSTQTAPSSGRMLIKIAPKVKPSSSGDAPGSVEQQSRSEQLEAPAAVINQCHSCKILLLGTRHHLVHMKKHEAKGEATNLAATTCVICQQLVDNSALINHLKNHQSQGKIICCRCQRTDFPSMAEAVKHAEHFCGYRLVLSSDPEDIMLMTNRAKTDTPHAADSSAIKDADKSSFNKDADKSSANKEVDNSSANKEVDNSSVSEEADTSIEEQAAEESEIEADISPAQNSLFPCLLCGLAFESLSSREDHISRSHDGTKMVYRCLKCKRKDNPKQFSKKESVARHIIKKHRIVGRADVEKFIGGEEHNASSGQKLPEAEASSLETCDATPPKRLRIAEKGDFLCGKCGLTCCEYEEFSTHILTHNGNKEPQCPECGLCFTVVPALMKHLRVVHKIKAVEEFLKSKCILIPDLAEDEGLEDEIFPQPKVKLVKFVNCIPVVRRISTNPLECTVCYKVFDTETDLKTHMRNHGMAFIKSKRHKP